MPVGRIPEECYRTCKMKGAKILKAEYFVLCAARTLPCSLVCKTFYENSATTILENCTNMLCVCFFLSEKTHKPHNGIQRATLLIVIHANEFVCMLKNRSRLGIHFHTIYWLCCAFKCIMRSDKMNRREKKNSERKIILIKWKCAPKQCTYTYKYNTYACHSHCHTSHTATSIE